MGGVRQARIASLWVDSTRSTCTRERGCPCDQSGLDRVVAHPRGLCRLGGLARKALGGPAHPARRL